MAYYQNNNIFNHLISDGGQLNRSEIDNDSDSSSSNNANGNGRNGKADSSAQQYPWSSYSLSQLQDLLRQRGQLSTGSRSTLKKRLKNLERSAGTAALTKSTDEPIKTTSANGRGGDPAAVPTSVNCTAPVSSTTTNTTTTSTTTATTSVSRVTPSVHRQTNGNSTKSASSGSMESIGSSASSEDLTERTKLHDGPRRPTAHPLRSRVASRSNSFSAHFADYIKRRRDALETERQEISIYTSPLTVFSYFVLYLLHEFRMALLWILSQQYLLVVLPAVAALIYFVYQTDGAHQPLLKHAESGVIWYGYWILLGVASSIGLGTGLHTFVLFLGPHIAEVTLAAYECGNVDFESRGDHRFVCNPRPDLTVPLTLWAIFRTVQWESFFWGLGTALGELPPYFVARAAALSGDRNEELAAIEDLLKKTPDAVSYKERILLTVHEGMKRLGFFGIFLCASIPNPLFDLAGITCGHFLIPFSTFFGATFLGKAVVKSSIQTMFVIIMFSADSLAAIMTWLEGTIPLLHGYLADGIKSQKGALGRNHAGTDGGELELDDSTSLVGLIWNTIIFIMISYFLLSIAETMALAQIKRRHDQEIVDLEGKIRSGDTKALIVAVSEEMAASSATTTTTTTTTATTRLADKKVL